MGTDFLFTPSCDYPSMWNKIHDKGRNRKPTLVMNRVMDGGKRAFSLIWSVSCHHEFTFVCSFKR